MKGTYSQLKLALRPLGDALVNGGELKYNCPRCEKSGAPKDKHNLEVNHGRNLFHCWACNYKGSLYRIVKDYGYKDFLHLFQPQKDDILDKARKRKTKLLSLPEYCISALNNEEAKDYLFSRKITKEQIIERQIKYCYSGEQKGLLLFPNYNSNNELTHYLSHNFKTGEYKQHKASNFTAFYEMFIDKRSPIILTEGVYDALVLPNAIPLLGLTITENLLLFLSKTTAYLIVDSVVEKKQVTQMLKELNKVCDAIHISFKGYKDPNEIAQDNQSLLPELLEKYY